MVIGKVQCKKMAYDYKAVSQLWTEENSAVEFKFPSTLCHANMSLQIELNKKTMFHVWIYGLKIDYS